MLQFKRGKSKPNKWRTVGKLVRNLNWSTSLPKWWSLNSKDLELSYRLSLVGSLIKTLTCQVFARGWTKEWSRPSRFPKRVTWFPLCSTMLSPTCTVALQPYYKTPPLSNSQAPQCSWLWKSVQTSTCVAILWSHMPCFYSQKSTPTPFKSLRHLKNGLLLVSRRKTPLLQLLLNRSQLW